jgi:hypothetical protein
MQSEIEVTQADDLQRWGFRWKGHDHGTHELMDDGYWTPWHEAAATIASLRAEIERLKAGPTDTDEAVWPLVAVMRREGWWRAEIMLTDNGGWQASYEPHDIFLPSMDADARPGSQSVKRLARAASKEGPVPCITRCCGPSRSKDEIDVTLPRHLFYGRLSL